MDNIGKYIAALRQSWKLALSIAVVVSAALAIVVWFLPNQYSATTTILVDPQKIPDKYVSTTVTEDPNERLSNLTQEVLSRTRLSQIAERFNLYPEMSAKKGKDYVIAYLRTQVQIQLKKNSGAAMNAFTITYRSGDRQDVAKVTNQLAQTFIDWNLEQRQNLVEGTTRFLNDELEQARKGLEEQETHVRDYRMQHLGEMPEQMEANLETLGRLQIELQAKSDALNRMDQERLLLMHDSGGVASIAGTTTYASPRAQMNAQVVEARKRLDELNARYKPQHPDVLAAQDHLHELQAQLANMSSAGSSGSQPSSANGGSEASARLQLLNQQKGQVAQQQSQLEQEIRHYQHLVDAVPVRQAEVSGLMRDYDSAKTNYQSLLEKSYSADMATELERKQQGERFQVLDSAVTPERPDSPNRVLFWVGSLLAGIAAGIGTIVVLENMDSTVKTEAELLSLLPKGAIVLGHIPQIRTSASFVKTQAWSNE